jgi:hypothetical protein
MDELSSFIHRVRSTPLDISSFIHQVRSTPLDLTLLNDRLDSISVDWKVISLCLFSLWFISFIVRHVISYRRLRAFDGPFWAAVTQFWLFQKTAKGVINTEMRKITEKYGKYLNSS